MIALCVTSVAVPNAWSAARHYPQITNLTCSTHCPERYMVYLSSTNSTILHIHQVHCVCRLLVVCKTLVRCFARGGTDLVSRGNKVRPSVH
ncbi:hypothetical protein EV702DRAFT_1090041 [Suillus placidus]|uniref:Uncharacterized protein n=1 Tax=Suillus placidus TaxID=48579 RepID=A0A9P7D4F2_9AGAM|nr:hypothetical protein EV702DRAFT_1090041 [Suillus placidus]